MNIIDIEYSSDSYKLRADEELVRTRISKILDLVEKDDVELSVSFVSDDEILQLNKQWRSIESPTDILSFVQADSKDEDDFWPDFEEEDSTVLGDMVISLDAVDRNCENFNVSFDEELYRLLIHGVLHLIGHDHKTNDKTEPMLIFQEQLLSSLREA